MEPSEERYTPSTSFFQGTLENNWIWENDFFYEGNPEDITEFVEIVACRRCVLFRSGGDEGAHSIGPCDCRASSNTGYELDPRELDEGSAFHEYRAAIARQLEKHSSYFVLQFVECMKLRFNRKLDGGGFVHIQIEVTPPGRVQVTDVAFRSCIPEVHPSQYLNRQASLLGAWKKKAEPGHRRIGFAFSFWVKYQECSVFFGLQLGVEMEAWVYEDLERRWLQSSQSADLGWGRKIVKELSDCLNGAPPPPGALQPRQSSRRRRNDSQGYSRKRSLPSDPLFPGEHEQGRDSRRHHRRRRSRSQSANTRHIQPSQTLPQDPTPPHPLVYATLTPFGGPPHQHQPIPDWYGHEYESGCSVSKCVIC